MKKAFTLLVFLGAMASQLMAQIPNTSPIPVEFSVQSTGGFDKVFEYSSGADWGDTLAQTVSAPLIWAYSQDSLGSQSDSLLCDSMAFNDLTGKIALIRRGDCNFTLKAYRAQQAGAVGVIIVNHTYNADGGGLVGMSGALYAAETHIPSIFITRDDGDIILSKLDAGEPVTATFTVRAFGGPRTAYSYHTPLTAVKPLSDIGVTFLNIDAVNTLPSVTINAEITAPGGATTTLSQTLINVAPVSVNNVKFDDSYTPTAIGTYSVKFTNSLTPDEITQDFVITDYTFAIDNGVIVPNTNGTIEPDSANFVNLYFFQYDMGNVYRTGPTPVVATHMSFMISNPDELYSGDPDADRFDIVLYNADPDGNGSIPYPAGLTSYNGLNENGGPLIPLTTTEYIISQDDQGFEFITVEFPSPVNLAANKMYLIMVQYNGAEAGTGIPPKYAFGGNERLAGEVGTMIFTDSLHTDGWGSAYQGIVRLHLDGFATGTTTALDDHKIAVSPNPTTNNINLELALDNPATEVEVHILDFTGRLVSSRTLDHVQKGRYSFDVSKLATGTYFMSVNTPEGFRSKKFQVIR
ncbi:MAG: T9SS type A sorting domain-containing protein [Saprospiraceae bacterium]|nr:T9SS type A sorting domain-containing protein [Saprospiraceae bacterium]MCF8249647.1 T9SS type A sorting domain-containing protein [Saprospiraceae bacterium]MCF8280457.1 T9SS type A sorting domain-containing protein [Bacteroidales bacterium]MCF8310479.1 T9SS type A sorting domain-containing protein [Saprospiraceae bacterium]MCF8439857.1 T9SS type A sorting domain-containing protein [Saprospiraceae bacterium]